MPRLPHPWGAAAQHRLAVDVAPFGRIELAFRTFGAGPPLLLVHGLMTAGYSWRYVLEPLGAHFTLFIPDLPGSGASAMPACRYPADAVARAIAAFQEVAGIRGCAAIGNSMGGYLCMRLALRDPQAMSRLVNLHSPGVPLARLWALRAAMALPFAPWLLRRLVHRDPERWVQRNVHYYDETLKSREETGEYARPLASREGVAAFAATLRDTLDPRDMAAFTRELAALRDRGHPFPVPLLLLYAERDPMVPPSVGEKLRSLVPDARFVTLPEASHFAHVDAVDRFLPPVLEFLGVRR